MRRAQDYDWDALAKRVLIYRTLNGLSMEKFADVAGVSKRSVFNAEHAIPTLSIYTITKIENAMKGE